jgi:UDP-glucose 4-epimerase
MSEQIEQQVDDDSKKVDEIFAQHASKPVTPFMQQKLVKEAGKNWDMFYKRNTTNFFKVPIIEQRLIFCKECHTGCRELK